MRNRITLWALLVPWMLLMLGTAQAQPVYQLTDLGRFIPAAIANDGIMAGQLPPLTSDGWWRAARGQVGAIVDLGVQGWATSQATGGLTAGTALIFDADVPGLQLGEQAVMWDAEGTITSLGWNTSGPCCSQVVGINNKGTIVGWGDAGALVWRRGVCFQG